MKSSSSTLAVLMSLLAGAVPALGGVNSLSNPGFELNNASGGDVNPVSQWPGFENNYASVSQARTGSNSLKLYGPGFQYAASGVSQTRSTSGNTVWELRAWVLTPSSAPLAGADYANIKLKFNDGGGEIKSMDAPFATSGLAPDAWTQLTVQAIAPTGTTQVVAELLFVQKEPLSIGEVYIDDVELVNLGAAPPAGPGVLSNASFETDDASSFDVPGASDWGGFNSSFTNSSVSRLERQSLKIFGPFFPEGGAGVVQGGFAAQAGDIWTAKAFALNMESDPIQGDNFAVVKVEFLDAGAQVLAGGESDPITSSAPYGTWIELSASGIAPSGTATVQIVLVHVQKNDPVTGGSVFFDDAGLAKSGELAGIVDISKSGDEASITFASESGSFYTLRKAVGELQNFAPIQPDIAGTGEDVIVVDTAASEDSAFYLVEKQMP